MAVSDGSASRNSAEPQRKQEQEPKGPEPAPAQQLPSSAQDKAKPSSSPRSVLKRNLVIVALGLGIFIGILDATIVATILPTLVDEFQSIDSAGWYGSAYLLVTGATQPTFGKLYSTFRPKLVFLVSILLLSIGSLVCALARASSVFIGGRAVAGLGAAGVVSGALVITALVVPLHLRPIYTSCLGSLEGIGLIVGPLIGGAIASNIGWRWCFWINLPVAAVLSVVIFFLLVLPPAVPSDDQKSSTSVKQQLLQLDLEGGLAIAGSLTCLLLAIQWGGTTYAWSDSRIIVLFVVFGVSIICVGFHQGWKGERATFPMRLLKNRTFAMLVLDGFCMAGAQFVVLYYLPIWFQAVQGASAQESGIKLLPTVLSVIVMAIFAGIGASIVGYIVPFIILATILGSVGAGLLHTLYPQISQSRWIGYQILFGAGSGMGVQQCIVGVQMAVDHADVAYATSAIMLVNTLSGAILIAVSQSLFLGEVVGIAQDVGLSDPLSSFQSSEDSLSPQNRQLVIQAYNNGVSKAILVALILCSITVVSWPLLKWIRIKQNKDDTEEANTETLPPLSTSTL
ncbi:major facilitator superfamily domain-containing protein [Camillea tinctor]|nr:major facilitator superfamily domain-containing protein [Camillea tinctor]